MRHDNGKGAKYGHGVKLSKSHRGIACKIRYLVASTRPRLMVLLCFGNEISFSGPYLGNGGSGRSVRTLL